jgi:hypothetical protein
MDIPKMPSAASTTFGHSGSESIQAKRNTYGAFVLSFSFNFKCVRLESKNTTNANILHDFVRFTQCTLLVYGFSVSYQQINP